MPTKRRTSPARAAPSPPRAIYAREWHCSRLPVGYYRLPGPAGHKSRYEDPAIEKLADIALAIKDQQATFVFTNVDMFADAKRLKKAMKLV